VQGDRQREFSFEFTQIFLPPQIAHGMGAFDSQIAPFHIYGDAVRAGIE
jgi:energy-converting hydrogenase Eha subunit A